MSNPATSTTPIAVKAGGPRTVVSADEAVQIDSPAQFLSLFYSIEDTAKVQATKMLPLNRRCSHALSLFDLRTPVIISPAVLRTPCLPILRTPCLLIDDDDNNNNNNDEPRWIETPRGLAEFWDPAVTSFGFVRREWCERLGWIQIDSTATRF
jgi:hypothetical protein